jgi:uncharacterized integral membrane protein (TIGR00697 family)
MRTRWLPVISGLFVGVLLISNIASVKLLDLSPFKYDAGTLLFPFGYIFGDILTEVYGYRASRKVIWTGFICAALLAGYLWLVGQLPGPESDWSREDQEAYMRILSPMSWIVLGSLVAFFSGEFSNSYILAKLKIYTKGKHLWIRTISSTLVGQGIDTVIFVLIANIGWEYSSEMVIAVILSNYIFKCGVEILFTPITYAIVIGLKKSEGIDVYDHDTNFNPFNVFEKEPGSDSNPRSTPGQ